MAIAAPTALEANQQIRIYNRVLQSENILYDPWTYSMGVHSVDSKTAIPNVVYIKLDANVKEGRYIQWSMLKELQGEPFEGQTLPTGSEERIVTKWAEAYSNDIAQAVPLEEYGLEAITKEPYRINENAVKLLNTYKAQLEGRYIRNALLETVSHNLTVAPHSLSTIFNPNFYISGLALTSQPVYADNAAAAWANTLATAMGGTTRLASASAKLRDLIKLDEYASTYKFIEPIMVDGKPTYLCLLPSPQCTYLKDPATVGSLGATFQLMNRTMDAEAMNFPTALGRVGRLLIIEDPRYPTLTVGGTSGNYTLTSAYCAMGRHAEVRDTTATAVQIGMLLGKGAIFELPHEDWHLEYYWMPYDKTYGLGIFATKGWMTPRYKTGATTGGGLGGTSIQQDSSIMLAFAPPPVTFV